MRLRSSALIWLTAHALAGLALPRGAQAQPAIAQLEPTAAGKSAAAADLEAPHGATPRELVKRLHAGKKLLLESNYAEGARLSHEIKASLLDDLHGR